MYERRFGISGPPFQLSPDPSFYFDGGQHREALMALRRAFAGSLPFIVLSGAIGAGKTTVLRTWLADLQSSGLRSASITNTQLDPEGLLSALALALGVDTSSQNDDGVLPALRRYLRGLRGAAIAIAIDEAQNLGPRVLSSLVDLTRAAAEEGALLRIVLAGQPELRSHVADPALPHLQALVQHACHLQPLGPDETRRYIEHRLHRVGWSGSPSFDPAAIAEIHRLAGGVPRRVNVITNRLLLGQFLSDTAHVGPQDVRDVAQMLDAEITDGSVAPHAPSSASPQLPVELASKGVLFLLASGRSDYIKVIALLFALQARPQLSTAAIVCLRNKCVWELNVALHGLLGKAPALIDLSEDAPLSGDQLERRFDAAVSAFGPQAVIVFDGDALSHRCAILAKRRGLSLAHVGADPQWVAERDDPTSPRAAIGRLANLRFSCQPEGADSSLKPDPASNCVGNLLVNALHIATQLAPYQATRDSVVSAVRLQRDPRRGFGVVLLKQASEHERASFEPGLLSLLKTVSRDLPLVWPVRGATLRDGHAAELKRELQGDRIAVVDELGYVDLVSLMRETTCVLTNSADVVEETAILGVPCLCMGIRHVGDAKAGGWLRVTDVSAGAAHATRAIWQILYSGIEPSKLPRAWDGHAAARISRALMQWLAGLPTAASDRDPQRPEPRQTGQRPGSVDVHSPQRQHPIWSRG